MNFSSIDELQDEVHLSIGDISHDDDRVLGTILLEHTSEVGGAGREHDSVSLERPSFAGQGHIDKELLLQQALKELLQTFHMAVPSQAQDTFLVIGASSLVSIISCGLIGHGGCLILVEADPIEVASDPGCMWREVISLLLFLFPPLQRLASKN